MEEEEGEGWRKRRRRGPFPALCPKTVVEGAARLWEKISATGSWRRISTTPPTPSVAPFDDRVERPEADGSEESLEERLREAAGVADWRRRRERRRQRRRLLALLNQPRSRGKNADRRRWKALVLTAVWVRPAGTRKGRAEEDEVDSPPRFYQRLTRRSLG